MKNNMISKIKTPLTGHLCLQIWECEKAFLATIAIFHSLRMVTLHLNSLGPDPTLAESAGPYTSNAAYTLLPG